MSRSCGYTFAISSAIRPSCRSHFVSDSSLNLPSGRRLLADWLTTRLAQGLLPTCNRTLVIVRVPASTLVVDEEGSNAHRGNLFKGERCLGKIEAIRKIVGRPVRVAERRQIEIRFDEFQYASEVVCDVRNVRAFRVG
jgi:hypothetical protein